MSTTTNNKVTQETSPEQHDSAQETAPEQHDSAQETAPEQDDSAQETAVIETPAHWSPTDWLGKAVIACDGKKIGKLHDVYVDVETDLPQFGTVKEGFFRKHLTFVPLVGVTVSPGGLKVTVMREQVRTAPNLDLHGQEMSQDDESTLYHHFKMNYIVIANESGRRLARR